MNILGVELEYDFFDADNIEKYERENQKVKDRISEKTQYEGKSTAEAFRIQCGIINDFFNEMFGKGTADKLFGGKCNIKKSMEAFGAVADEAMSCNGELSKISEKYSPNRAERRQQNKQNTRNFNRHAAKMHVHK